MMGGNYVGKGITKGKGKGARNGKSQGDGSDAIQLQPRKTKKLLCKPFLTGKAIANLQDNKDDPKFKTMMCAYRDMCKWGDACLFAHSPDELRGSARFGRKVRVRRSRTQSWWDDDSSWDNGWKGSARDDGWEDVICPMYQFGCCWFGEDCVMRHEYARADSGYRTMLCKEFFEGECSKDDCFYAHSKDELRTPFIWEGIPGYKACLCSFFLLDDLECAEENCFDAHGIWDLRRLKLSVPEALSGATFVYADAHIHLDEVLLQRRHGTTWFYKNKLCYFDDCTWKGCAWAHSKSELWSRQPVEKQDLVALAAEIDELPGGTFTGCVHSCCEVDSLELSVDLIRWGRECFGGRLYICFGIHPATFEQYTRDVEAQLEAAIEKCGEQVVAWGECGLDYYRRDIDIKRDPTVREKMCDVFARQARVAVRRGLPLVIHSRDAEDDTLKILRDEVPTDHPIYLHSYMGDQKMLDQVLETYPRSCVGVAGCITYETAEHLREMVREVLLERLLLETDGPYMAPGPHRGEEAHSGQIPLIAEAVASARGVTAVEVLEKTTANFLRFYRLQPVDSNL